VSQEFSAIDSVGGLDAGNKAKMSVNFLDYIPCLVFTCIN